MFDWKAKLAAWRNAVKYRNWQVYACTTGAFPPSGLWNCELFWPGTRGTLSIVRAADTIEEAVELAITEFKNRTETKRATAKAKV